MANKAPSFIRPAATPDDDKLVAIRAKAAEARDLQLHIKDLEDSIEALAGQLKELETKTLPDMMEELGIDKLGLNAEGNFPPYDIKLQPFYSASISAKWPQEQRQAAYTYLESIGEGDLIKANVTAPFPRDQHEKARALADRLMAEGLPVQFDESVHAQTLTAWLKRKIEDDHFMPDLTLIGGTVGKIVRLKERKQ